MADDDSEGRDRLDVAAHWDDIADRWARQVRQGWDVYREVFNNPAFFDFLGDVEGLDVLDAGCGEGHNTRLLADAGAVVTGADISSRMISLARRAEAAEPRGIRYVEADFADLAPFPGCSFDLVVSFMAVMDGDDLAGAVEEFHRVLRPGGRLAFNITHPCFVTPGFSWVRDESGAEVGLQVGDYFSDAPFVEEWTFSKAPVPADEPPFRVPRFPRTISEYVNTLVEAGLTLTKMVEPRPTADAVMNHGWLRRWRQHAALFLYVEATKPE